MIGQRSEAVAQLNRFAAAGNSGAPKMVNEYTQLDSVSVEFPSVVFNYTLMVSKENIDITALEQSEISWFLVNACNNQQVQEMVLRPGYLIQRRYTDLSGNLVLNIELGSEICNEHT